MYKKVQGIFWIVEPSVYFSEANIVLKMWVCMVEQKKSQSVKSRGLRVKRQWRKHKTVCIRVKKEEIEEMEKKRGYLVVVWVACASSELGEHVWQTATRRGGPDITEI